MKRGTGTRAAATCYVNMRELGTRFDMLIGSIAGYDYGKVQHSPVTLAVILPLTLCRPYTKQEWR
jgi:hypothetical protein